MSSFPGERGLPGPGIRRIGVLPAAGSKNRRNVGPPAPPTKLVGRPIGSQFGWGRLKEFAILKLDISNTPSPTAAEDRSGRNRTGGSSGARRYPIDPTTFAGCPLRERGTQARAFPETLYTRSESFARGGTTACPRPVRSQSKDLRNPGWTGRTAGAVEGPLKARR